MENRFQGPEDQDNLDSETPRKKRRSTDFISQYLLRRGEQSAEGVEQDDDDETDGKPKKFRRFFKGMFASIVERPSVPDQPIRQPRPVSLESLFGIGNAQRYELQDAAIIDGPPTTNELVGVEPAYQENVTQETPEIPGALEGYALPFTSQEDSQQPGQNERPVVEREVIIERGSGAALPIGFVGAEYLARKKAERKLDAKFSEKITRIEKEAEHSSKVEKELKTLVEQNRKQLDVLKRERGIQPAKTETKPPQPEKILIAPEYLAKSAQIKQELVINQRPVLAEKPSEKETYKIIEKITDEADHSVRFERKIERKHEVKDNRTTAASAASIGSIVADRAPHQNASSGSPVKTTVSAAKEGLPVIRDDQGASLYAQAVRNGFWAAMLIIVFGVIAYLLK